MSKLTVYFIDLIKYWINFKQRRLNRYINTKKKLSNLTQTARELEKIEAQNYIKRLEMFFTLEGLILFSALLSNFGHVLSNYIRLIVIKVGYGSGLSITLTNAQNLDVKIAVQTVIIFGVSIYILIMIVTIYLIVDKKKYLETLNNIE